MRLTDRLAFHNDRTRMTVVLCGMGLIALIDFIQKPIIVMAFYWAVIMVAATFARWKFIVFLSVFAIVSSALAGKQWGYLTSTDYLVRLSMGVVLSIIAIWLSKEVEVRNDRLMTLSLTDSLTGLPNRVLLYERLNSRLRQRNPVNPIVVVFIDIDNFKSVNDEYGHDVGDSMLREVGQRLSEIVRKEDTVARIGGDEFVIFCNSIADRAGAESLCERLVQTLRRPFWSGEHEIARNASMGCLITRKQTSDAETLIKLADKELLAIKESNKGGYRVVDLATSLSGCSDK